jgi:DNA repair protein RecN (Recombination protein N)
MLQFLNISNIALIDDMQVEFESGLNLLTGETGSGKSIIVDALGVLIGGRFTSELLKTGAERAAIEGLFSVAANPDLEVLLENAGLGVTNELIIRRELSATGRNKIFINNQLATQSLLPICGRFWSIFMGRENSRRSLIRRLTWRYSMLSRETLLCGLKSQRHTSAGRQCVASSIRCGMTKRKSFNWLIR